MTANNKILTVSYGTFSCTLEGFDDSFGTMKAIAEYFRDLASDDRYFGAEPPQPDVEMLARIAEREISRRVGAHERQGRYVLSAGEAFSEPQSTEEAKFASPIEDDLEQPDEMVDSTRNRRKETQTEPYAKCQEALHVEEQEASEPKTTEDELGTNLQTEYRDPNAQLDAPTLSREPAATIETSEQDEKPSPSEENEPEDAAAFFAQPPTDPEPKLNPLTDVASGNVAPADNSIAAKLQRIRAVVLKQSETADSPDTLDEDYTEDLLPDNSDGGQASSDNPEQSPPSMLSASQTPASMPEAYADLEEEAEDTEPSIAIEEMEVASILAQIEAETSSSSEAIDEHIENPDDDKDSVLVLEEPIRCETLASEPVKEDESEAGAPQAISDTNKRSEDTVCPSVPGADEKSPSEELLIEQKADQGTAAPSATRARIIKVKRSDIDAAIASGALEEIEDAEADSEQIASASEMTDMEAKGKREDQAANPETGEASPRATVKGDDVSRLMAEADSQLEEPEGSRRRSAFAHLKAAVMAKKSDAGIGTEDNGQDEAYRSDLASVVKPRRPEIREASAGAESKRPAPLTLVAEQRVDPEVVPNGPVRPRRVATRTEPNDPESATNFAAYADEMGAHDLPALLEAAASYLSFVEGREQFSRPQLMTKVRQIEKDQFSREDGLRHFGQLLRAGKIEKIKGGRFAVTGEIGFQPDQRAAG